MIKSCQKWQHTCLEYRCLLPTLLPTPCAHPPIVRIRIHKSKPSVNQSPWSYISGGSSQCSDRIGRALSYFLDISIKLNCPFLQGLPVSINVMFLERYWSFGILGKLCSWSAIGPLASWVSFVPGVLLVLWHPG